MLRLLKNYFIPHKRNGHHPHILRRRAFGYLLGMAVIIEVVFLISTFIVLPKSGFLALIAHEALVESANAARQETRGATLNTNALLQYAAQLKANDMVTKGYFAHTSPTGLTPWHWLTLVGYKYASAGENLAVNFIESGDVHRAWMNSPGHRQNILNSAYTEIGVASARGTFNGRETTFVVQFFGAPLTGTVAPAKIRSKPASVTPLVKASIAAQVAATPRTTANTLLILMSSFIVFALALTGLVRMRVSYLRIAALPVVLLVVLTVLVLVNQSIGLSALRIL